MYKIKQRAVSSMPLEEQSNDTDYVPYKPFSYFVLGGSDITGEHTNCTAPVINDTPEDLATRKPNMLCDQKTNFWTLSEHMSSRKARHPSTAKPDEKPVS